MYIITTWYKRHEVQKRLAVFYLVSILFGGFSSLLGKDVADHLWNISLIVNLAYGISHLKGKGGLNGWQWIFILEGIATIFLGILAWLFVPDFPEKSTFLSQEEKQMILDRVEADRGDSVADPMTGKKIITHLSDPVVWIMALMFLCSTMPAYAIGFFITILLNLMGYSLKMSFVLTAPPYVAAVSPCVIPTTVLLTLL